MPNQTIKKSCPIVFLAVLIAILSLGLAGCQGGEAKGTSGELKMASLEGMPAEVQSAPLTVQQAYQFAVANPDVMQKLPCYCGCGAMGHKSNYACYVSGTDANGKPVFDTHALGCSICVDITQDAMRLLKEGKSIAEIRQYVDATYAKYGPSNMP
jgi:hypothetical protein